MFLPRSRLFVCLVYEQQRQRKKQFESERVMKAVAFVLLCDSRHHRSLFDPFIAFVGNERQLK